MTRRRLSLGSLIVALLAVASANWYRLTDVAVARSIDGLDQISTARIVRGLGYLEPIGETRYLGFTSYGVIEKCLVVLGQEVDAGDTLMQLDSRVARHELAVAERHLALVCARREQLRCGTHAFKLQAAEHAIDLRRERLRHIKERYQRTRQVRQANALSIDEFEAFSSAVIQAIAELKAAEAEANYLKLVVKPEDLAVAEAEVMEAREEVALARARLDERELRAPCSGTILEILKQEGEAVLPEAGNAALVLGDLRQLRVRAEIDERYIHQLRVGVEALIYARGLGGDRYRGRISHIKSVMGPKAVFSSESAERKDIDVVQVLIDLIDPLSAPVGLRVDVDLFLDDTPPT